MSMELMPEQRNCGSCMLCCKLPSIDVLEKPRNTWCNHAKVGAGCAIYLERPSPCRQFNCYWLEHQTFGDEWKPDKAGFYFYGQDGNLILLVDPSKPRAYEKPQFFDRLRLMAGEVLKLGGRFIIVHGNNGALLLPDREVPLGKLADIERIDVRWSKLAREFEVAIIRKE